MCGCVFVCVCVCVCVGVCGGVYVGSAVLACGEADGHFPPSTLGCGLGDGLRRQWHTHCCSRAHARAATLTLTRPRIRKHADE